MSVSEQLGEAVDRLAEQVGTRVGLAVPPRVELRVAEAEVRGEVDDAADTSAQRRHDGLRSAVGQAQEREVDVVDGGVVR